jgi:antitoxin component YwqK of YwqJK toxin-antitoxin module
VIRPIILLAFTAVAASGLARTKNASSNKYADHIVATAIIDDTRVTAVNGVTTLDGAPFTGTLRSRHENGAIKRLATYREGRLEGLARGFYPNGSPWYLRTYHLGREEGVHRGWWENGVAKFISNYHDGKPEGLAREWFEDGSSFTEFHFVAGQEAGSQRMWTRYGKLRANYIIKDGRRFGLMGSMGCQDRQAKTEKS